MVMKVYEVISIYFGTLKYVAMLFVCHSSSAAHKKPVQIIFFAQSAIFLLFLLLFL